MTAESKGSVATVLDICALSMVMLSARAARGVSPAGSVMQLFGVIGHLEENKLLQYVDEPCWRAMMVACGSVDAHDFGHKASCVLFETMKSCVAAPDALAYVQYCQSFSRKVRYIPENMNSFVDPFFFLEQLGLSWFAQKTLPPEDRSVSRDDSFDISPMPSGQSTPVKTNISGQMTPPSDLSRGSHSPGTPRSGSNIWRIFKGGKRDITAAEAGTELEETTNKPLVAFQELATALQLDKPIACYALRAPRHVLIGVISKYVEPAQIPDEFQISDMNINDRVKKLRYFDTRMRDKSTEGKCAAVQAVHDTDGSDFVVPKGLLRLPLLNTV